MSYFYRAPYAQALLFSVAMLSLSFSSRLSSNDRSSWGKKRMSSNATSTSTLPMGNTSGISTPQFPLTNPSHTGLKDSSSLQSNTGDVSLAPPLAAYRSVSSPTTPSLPKVTPKVTKHSSLQSTPTQPTLKVDPRILSVSDAGTGSGKMLSPIVEQDYFSPARRSVALPTDNGVQMQDVTLPPPISKFSDAPRMYTSCYFRVRNLTFSNRVLASTPYVFGSAAKTVHQSDEPNILTDTYVYSNCTSDHPTYRLVTRLFGSS